MIAYFYVIPGWLELVSLAFCTGVIVCHLWVFPWPALSAYDPCINWILRVWRLFVTGVLVMVVCTAINLLARSVEMSGSGLPSILPVLPTVIFETHFGHVWLVRIGAEVFTLGFFLIFRQSRNSRVFLILLLILMLIISATESASGHPSDKGDFSLPELTDWLHLAGVSFWGGGLLVLALTFPEILKSGADRKPFIAADVAGRFSRVAGIAVSVVGISALYNTFLYVGKLSGLWTTNYGLTLIAKAALFLILIGLGALNRYVYVPCLQKWAGAPVDHGIVKSFIERLVPAFLRQGTGAQIASRFRRSIRIEAFLIIIVLLCASFLRHEMPTIHVTQMKHGRGGGAIHEGAARKAAGQPMPHGTSANNPNELHKE